MRRYDLDWLRVIVFGLLIFYHVGMFFVPWGFHIKNDIVYSWLRWPMLFLNQWRLPILFVISGMGTFYALSKRTGIEFSKERLKRLLIPLLVGMAVIIPPQVYLERLAHGQIESGYIHYWTTQAFIGIYPKGNLSWHHLWFLPYLLLFSLILAPVFLYLRKHPEAWLLKGVGQLATKPFGLFALIIPLYFWEALLEPFFPSTLALAGDWFNLVNYVTFFFYGFLLISVSDIFWKTTTDHRRKYLICGIVGFSTLMGMRMLFEDSTLVHFIEAFFKVFNLWAWILALFGYAAAYLNKPSNALSYSSAAVYPFYILHQTIMMVIGFYLMHMDMGLLPKFSIMVIGTFGISWMVYEFFIRRWIIMRSLFGMNR